MTDLFPAPSVWVCAARIKTLPAAAAPVLVGWAIAFADGVYHMPSALLALVGALLIQIGTNFHNDYADFEKGTDDESRLGPLRVTAAGMATPAAMKRATLAVFGLAVVSGTYLMIRGGLPIVVIGATALACAFLYTGGRYSLAYLGIADLFVLVFFGPVAVAGTYYVQALAFSQTAVLAGIAPGLLSVAILLVNNIRDVEGDAAAGKRTLVVRIGRRPAVGLYAACFAAAALVPLALLLWAAGSIHALAASLIVIPAVPLIRRVADPVDPAGLNPVLGRTAQLLLLYCVLFSVGWVL